MLFCTNCELNLEESNFYKCSRTKRGFQVYCKPCKTKIGKTAAEKRMQNFVPLIEKECSVCFENKDISNFTLNVRSNDFYSKTCKSCKSEYDKQFYTENKEEKVEYSKTYRDMNKALVSKKQSEFYKLNKGKYNPRYREYAAKQRLTNPLYKLTQNVRSRVLCFLKTKNIKKQSHTFELIGCNKETLKNHLEVQFKDGMTWENQGKFGWHIDHIIPLSSGKTEEEIYKLCHYTNLQPLWAVDNLKKGAKIS